MAEALYINHSKYGFTDDGIEIFPPAGWKLLKEGDHIPQVHREFIDYVGTTMWNQPKRCRSTMTPMWAGVWGAVRAFAVPEDATIELSEHYVRHLELKKMPGYDDIPF